eukprot:TRINITY_DN10228_c0_g2_i2.p4 TRINITY_DN10228_c0_g2~~TRINITY_DN10228_c0_g2_i2.p4  ORF type:complete len:110 (+),score=1.82 TRINITY_DN10228_c0_g2_i2:414-743(+)
MDFVLGGSILFFLGLIKGNLFTLQQEQHRTYFVNFFPPICFIQLDQIVFSNVTFFFREFFTLQQEQHRTYFMSFSQFALFNQTKQFFRMLPFFLGNFLLFSKNSTVLIL